MQWDVIKFFVRSMLIILINKYIKFIKILSCSLNYFSVAIKHHDQGNLLERRLYLEVTIPEICHGPEYECRQSVIALEQQLRAQITAHKQEAEGALWMMVGSF